MSEVLTNEQKYKTAEERVKAFHDYCRSHKNGCEYCQLKQFQDDETCVCFAYWLPLEAEYEKKPKPCTTQAVIEAAYRREVAELRNGISELLNALQKIYDEECTDYGTGEVYDKWRKALEGVEDEGK